MYLCRAQTSMMMSNVGIYGGAMASLTCAILAEGPPSALMMWSAVSSLPPARAPPADQVNQRL